MRRAKRQRPTELVKAGVGDREQQRRARDEGRHAAASGTRIREG